MTKSDLIEMLLAGNSRFNVELVAHHIGTDQHLFDLLLELMISENPPISNRAAWVMTVVTDRDPWMVQAKLPELIDLLPRYNHPGISRGLLRLLEKTDLPSEKLGQLFDYCYNNLNDTKAPVAIRMFSMQILYNISEKEVDLKAELKLLIESHMDDSSPGFANRAAKLLKKLNKQVKA
jgi:hypothetical protein